MTKALLSLPEILERYLFIDVESSGLHADSYPIEIGWCSPDLASDSFLIKPHQSWGDEGWSYTSERIHGLSRDTLVREGVDVTTAASRLNDIVSGRTVVSDNPEYDYAWIGRLYVAAEVKCGFTVAETAQLERTYALKSGLLPEEVQALQESVKEAFPHPHRAAADARRAAALFLCLAMPDKLDAIIAAA